MSPRTVLLSMWPEQLGLLGLLLLSRLYFCRDLSVTSSYALPGVLLVGSVV